MNFNNFASKLLILIFLSGSILVILNIVYIKNPKFKDYINSNYPKIQKTIFATPASLDYEKKIREILSDKYSTQLSYLEQPIDKTQFLNFEETKYPLNTYKYTGNVMKAVAFIDFYEDNLFLVSGIGEISFIKEKDIPNFKSKLISIPSNIKDIIKDKSFYDTEAKVKFSQFNSISDILIVKDYIYLSFNRVLKDNCYTKSIIRSKINFNFLKFEDFFYNKTECRNTSENKKKYNGHQSGGRMVLIDNDSIHNIFNDNEDKILFTIGDYRSNRSNKIPLSHDKNSIFGKTLLIDINTKEHRIFTQGHRNPQGLYYDQSNQIIISTEHGPYGGDEINILSKNKDYGWPTSSYGENYGYKNNGASTAYYPEKDFYFKKDHYSLGYEEPLLAFTKSIGISEIIKTPDSFDYKWKNSYLATSLNGHAIIRFNLNTKFDKIQSIEIIKIGERIRDIKFYKNKIYTILENSASLGVYSILD